MQRKLVDGDLCALDDVVGSGDSHPLCNEYSLSAFISNGIHRSVESHVAAEDLMPLQRSMSGPGLSVKLFSCELYCKM